jgi:hypothetical protein
VKHIPQKRWAGDGGNPPVFVKLRRFPIIVWDSLTSSLVNFTLVGGIPTPLKNISSSVGIVKFPIYGKICSKPPTSPCWMIHQGMVKLPGIQKHSTSTSPVSQKPLRLVSCVISTRLSGDRQEISLVEPCGNVWPLDGNFCGRVHASMRKGLQFRWISGI